MEISQVYQRTNISQQAMQQSIASRAAASSGVAGVSGEGNAPLVPSASSHAIAGELGVTAPYENFNINNIDKVTQVNNTEKISKLGSVKSQYFEPAIGMQSFLGGNVSLNSNSSLSFMRGELGVNLPLNGDAIYTNGGMLAANLNIIC